MPWGNVRQQTELCTSKFWYLYSVLAGRASWPLLSPKHAGSSRGRSFGGALPAPPVPALPPTQGYVPTRRGDGRGDHKRLLSEG